MQIAVVSGLSGSGKSTALRSLEDLGYYAIDNLPFLLLDRLIDLLEFAGEGIEQVALVIDARSVMLSPASERNRALEKVPSTLEEARRRGHQVDLVFLDSSDEMLTRRFSETRRRHPLDTDGSVQNSIQTERTVLEPLRNAATCVLETSRLSPHDLKAEIQRLFQNEKQTVEISVLSFGFKKGVPLEADLMFDVRFLPNPYFIEGLREKTGQEPEVSDFVLSRPAAKRFLHHLESFLKFLLPQYKREGKSYLTIAIGCTGGKHRSVSLAEEIGLRLRNAGWECHIRHRDIGEITASLPGVRA